MITGVLAGALLVKPTRPSQASVDLGYAGLEIIDRKGQALLSDFTRPRNGQLLARIQRGEPGALSGTAGLDGSRDQVVSFATAKVPGWAVVIDRPASTVFAAARRSLLLNLALIAGVAGIVLVLIGRIVARARRDAEREATSSRASGRNWRSGWPAPPP